MSRKGTGSIVSGFVMRVMNLAFLFYQRFQSYINK
jgi:hypothetical protein